MGIYCIFEQEYFIHMVTQYEHRQNEKWIMHLDVAKCKNGVGACVVFQSLLEPLNT